MTRAEVARHRVGVDMQRRGTPLTWRRTVAAGTGPAPDTNPPRHGPLSALAAPAGASSLTLVSPDLVGRFVAGDQLDVTGRRLTLASPASAESNPAATGLADAFRAVLALTNPLLDPIQDGAAVAPAWACDRTVPGLIQAAPKRVMQEGALIQVRSFVVTLAAALLPEEPSAQDRVVLPMAQGERIVDFVDIVAMDGLALAFRLQVR